VGWQKRPCDGWSAEARIEEAKKERDPPLHEPIRKDGVPAAKKAELTVNS
jgi:hypothetical protein